MSTLSIQRQQTRAFIASDPTTIALIPSEVTVLPNGGKSKIDGIPRTPQKFKLISQESTGLQQRPTVLVDGVERIITYVLLGEWNSVMEVWDHWTDPEDGSTYTIVAISEGFKYERKGLVERHLPVT